jgi:hypothetical protein
MRSKSVLTICLVLCVSSLFAQQQPANPCNDAQQKQFDFWVGEWDLTTPGAKQGEVNHSSNSIKRILGGCIVQENFLGGEATSLLGMSVSVFDPVAKKWKQTWVDNQGTYLDFIGEFGDGKMILSREAMRPDGTKVLQRMVWKNISANELDWSWERSLDKGQTWEVMWPVHYKRKS